MDYVVRKIVAVALVVALGILAPAAVAGTITQDVSQGHVLARTNLDTQRTWTCSSWTILLGDGKSEVAGGHVENCRVFLESGWQWVLVDCNIGQDDPKTHCVVEFR